MFLFLSVQLQREDILCQYSKYSDQKMERDDINVPASEWDENKKQTRREQMTTPQVGLRWSRPGDGGTSFPEIPQ